MKAWSLIALTFVSAIRVAHADVGDAYKATGYEVIDDDYDGRLEHACTRFPEAEEQAKLREYPERRTTLSAGLTVPATGGDRGFGVGVHVRGEQQLHLPEHPRLFLRGVVEPTWAGRFGALGEAAIGVTIYHAYGTFYRGSRDYLVTTTTEVDRGDYIERTTSTAPVHLPAICTVAARDIHLFTGIRAGAFLGKDVGMDPVTGLTTHANTEGWTALELGLTDIKRAADHSWREETLAFVYDVLYGGRPGVYARVAAPLFGAYSAGDLLLIGGGTGNAIFIVTASWGARWE